MALRTTYSSEDWTKVYQAFAAVNFTSYDFDTVKQALIEYTRTYYPEQFNDYIQSSEFIMLLEIFAYICEQLAYRIDVASHENFITTAQRKQSILRLAKLISYKATRNVPLRGLVKFNSVSTTEQVIDSRGINLSGLTINWNDPNNPNWKEQFFLVMNRVLTTRFGQPQKTMQIGDVVMDLYSFSNLAEAFPVGVFAFTANTSTESLPMELVPVDLDENGPFEREPDPAAAFSIIYANDGIGDNSDYTGFLAHIKQGTLSLIDYFIEAKLPNRKIDFLPTGVNHTDVWVQKVNGEGRIVERWMQVDSLFEQNLAFNSIRDTRNKYEVDTLENDRIKVVFGDGDFAEVPQGLFRFWMRQSLGRSVVLQKNQIVNQPMAFTYVGLNGLTETCSLTFSLTTTLQNASATEGVEQLRRNAPATYYSQNRMVNAQDYNTFMLKDPSILRLKAVNRTFAGQPKYIDWNDASGQYENIKLFGDDLSMRYTIGLNSQTASINGRALIDSVIEPLLSDTGIVNFLIHLSAQDPVTTGVVSPPRRRFIEDNRGGLYLDKNGNPVSLISTATADGSLKEKTSIQGLIDRHWYGEPLSTVVLPDNTVLGVIPDPSLFPKDDSRIYAENLPRTIDGVNKFPPGDIGSGLQTIGAQEYFALRYNRYMRGIGNGTINTTPSTLLTPGSWRQGVYWLAGEVFTIEFQEDGVTYSVRSSLRGTFPPGALVNGTSTYSIQPSGFAEPTEIFTITAGAIPFEQGDAFILDTSAASAQLGALAARTFPSVPGLTQPINLNGWWQLLSAAELPAYNLGNLPDSVEQIFSTASGDLQYSWLIYVKKIRSQPSNTVIGYEVHHRTLKLEVESRNTKFWYNSVDQLMDNETKKRVFDNIKVLRSNLDGADRPLGASQKYDVVGAVVDSNGVIDVHKLEVVPTDLLNENESGDLTPDRVLQFYTFAASSYEYFAAAAPSVIFGETSTDRQKAVAAFVGAPSTALSAYDAVEEVWYGRRLRMPKVQSAADAGLDFMWQHFTPFSNIVDPSVTNIHDIYLMTRGYYDNIIGYLRGSSSSFPTPPTPLQLRSDFGYLLQNKMLSDTVVLHPGKVKLLFGSKADPRLRAKFKVVRAAGASLTNERIREEILNVINTFFDIDNWDFGDTFYATELITLIHQRLPTDISSVVLVPVYSTNSFGSLFTVESGHDEILQSAATIEDIEMVEALTPTVIRQVV